MEALNAVILKQQKNIITYYDFIRAFMVKFDVWKCRIKDGNTDSFADLDSDLFHIYLDYELKKQVLAHLTKLIAKFIRYFPDVDEKREAWKFIRNPFDCDAAYVSDDVQLEFLELKFNFSA